jgi:hypothetical protein
MVHEHVHEIMYHHGHMRSCIIMYMSMYMRSLHHHGQHIIGRALLRVSVCPAVMAIGPQRPLFPLSVLSFYLRGVVRHAHECNLIGRVDFYRVYSVRIQAQLRDLSLYLLYRGRAAVYWASINGLGSAWAAAAARFESLPALFCSGFGSNGPHSAYRPPSAFCDVSY